MPTSLEQWAALFGILAGLAGAGLVLHKTRSDAATRKVGVLAYLRQASAYVASARAWIIDFYGPPYFGGRYHFHGGFPRASVSPPPMNVPSTDFEDDVIRSKLVAARVCVDEAKGLLDRAMKEFDSASI